MNEQNHEVIVRDDMALLGTESPDEMLARATVMADALAQFIKSRKLSVRIGDNDYVRVEGWITMLAFMGITPVEDTVDEKDGTYIATVSLVNREGRTVGRASSECGMDEPTWANRPAFQRRSMAITRATGKAARIAFSWIMVAAGFAGTPSEEMDTGGYTNSTQKSAPGASQSPVRRMESRFASVCEICGTEIQSGTEIAYYTDKKRAAHWICHEQGAPVEVETEDIKQKGPDDDLPF